MTKGMLRVTFVWGQQMFELCVGVYMKLWPPQWLKVVKCYTLCMDVCITLKLCQSR